jgi:hypothetical protein
MTGDKNKMSTAKERYYSLIEDFEIGVLQEITDYVAELEQQVEELKKENVRLSNLIRYSRE